MSQPIYLYDKEGKQVVLYAPTYAAEQVAAGELFEEKPEPKPEPAPKPKPRRRTTRKPRAKAAK